MTVIILRVAAIYFLTCSKFKRQECKALLLKEENCEPFKNWDIFCRFLCSCYLPTIHQ